MVSEDSPRLAIPLLTSWGESATSCVQHLLSIFTLSTSWADKSSEHIAADAAQAIAEILELEFAAVQFSASSGVETFRHSPAKDDASGLILEALTQMNFPWPTSGVSDWRSPSGGPMLRVARIPVGLGGDGWLFAGSSKPHFPEDSEFVLLCTCANQIAIALQYCRIEAALRESEERFRKFAEYSANVLWILDANAMRIEYLSSAFARIWGQAPETMLGSIDRWAGTIYPEDRNDALAALDSVLRGDVVIQRYRIVRSKFEVRWIRHMLFPIRDAEGGVTRVGGIAEDISKSVEFQIYVLIANDFARESVSLLLQRSGYNVKCFTSPRLFLEVAPVLVPGCLLFDERESDTQGLRIVRELRARLIDLPVIVIGDSRSGVSVAVNTIKAGATDWLEAPYEEANLLSAVGSALAGVQDAVAADRASGLAQTHVSEMTPRERDVLLGLVAGETNKEIARRLDISPRTVELHRARVMERLGAQTLSEAVLLAAAAGLIPGPAKSWGGGP